MRSVNMRRVGVAAAAVLGVSTGLAVAQQPAQPLAVKQLKGDTY